MPRSPIIIRRFSYHSVRAKRRKRAFLAVIALFMAVVLLWGAGIPGINKAVPAMTAERKDAALKPLNLLTRLHLINDWREVIDRSLPLNAFVSEEKNAGDFDLAQAAARWVRLVTRVEPGSSRSILSSQMPALAEAAQFEEAAQSLPPLPEAEELPVTAAAESLPKDAVLVGFYSSHNAETYKPTDGTDRLPGKNGGVVKVAQAITETLGKDFGINAVHDATIHDYPHWGASYGNSEETAKKLLAQYPDLQILVDVHRDAGIRGRETVTINGQKAAKIMLVVGTDERWDHPDWRRNLAFAKQVEQAMEELYPGLSAGVRSQSGRYNQHLHPHAILAEMGSAENSLEEAQTAGRLFARVLAEVLKESE